MRVLNIMFGKGLGGIEQCLLDYCECLQQQGCEATAMIHPQAHAVIQSNLDALNTPVVTLPNLGEWDILAKRKLKHHLRTHHYDAIIAHGKRAVKLAHNAARATNTHIISVTHNYRLDYMQHVDAVFATTEALKQAAIKAGVDATHTYRIPNMVRLSEPPTRRTVFNPPPTIISMGRFVEKKGMHVLVEACAILREHGVEFTLKLGGDGAERLQLESLITQHNLHNHVELIGWVADKPNFFADGDIFVLPSLHEPFGIILLEAFAAQIPVITSDAEGPAEIATHEHDALIVPKGDATALADALELLIHDLKKAAELANRAKETVQHYALESVAGTLHDALQDILMHKGATR